jgi:hypothetical protein
MPDLGPPSAAMQVVVSHRPADFPWLAESAEH